MSLYELLARIRLYRLLLIDEKQIRRVLRKHPKGLRELLRYSDMRYALLAISTASTTSGTLAMGLYTCEIHSRISEPMI